VVRQAHHDAVVRRAPRDVSAQMFNCASASW